MKTINKMQYTAPMVEVMNARVEKGFFLSSFNGENLQEGDNFGDDNFDDNFEVS